MNTLNTIPNKGTFGASVEQMNQNFSLIVTAINELDYKTTRSKGILNNGTTPAAAITNAVKGDWCMVLGSGNTFPATIYTYNGTTWKSGGTWGPDGTIDLQGYYTKTQVNEYVAAEISKITIETADNLTTEETGKALDAHQGYVIGRRISSLEDTIGEGESSSSDITGITYVQGSINTSDGKNADEATTVSLRTGWIENVSGNLTVQCNTGYFVKNIYSYSTSLASTYLGLVYAGKKNDGTWKIETNVSIPAKGRVFRVLIGKGNGSSSIEVSEAENVTLSDVTNGLDGTIVENLIALKNNVTEEVKEDEVKPVTSGGVFKALEETKSIISDINNKSIFLSTIKEDTYINADGDEVSYEGINTYIYNVISYDSALYIYGRVGTSSRVTLYDSDNNIISQYQGTSDSGINFNKVISVPSGTKSIAIPFAETYEHNIEIRGRYGSLVGDVVPSLGILIPKLSGYLGTSGEWIFTNAGSVNAYVIPLENISTIRINTNSENGTLYSFFNSFILSSRPQSVAPSFVYAEGYINQRELSTDENAELQVPRDAKYLYINCGTGDARKPDSIVLLKESTCSSVGIPVAPFSVEDGVYISKSTEEEESSAATSLYTFDVQGIACLYIKARIAGLAVCLFKDSNDDTVARFLSQTSNSGINTDGVYNVPAGATTLLLSVAVNYGLTVLDCTATEKDNKMNQFSSKRVAFIGDSITYGFSLGGNYTKQRYPAVFSSLARCYEVNLGVSGTCIASNTLNDKHDERFVTRATAENIGDADVVFVFGGTNDFSYDSKPIGDYFKIEDLQEGSGNWYVGTKKRVAPDDTDTFAGGLHNLILTIRDVNPTARLIFITPINRGLYESTNKTLPRSSESNLHGEFLQDFCDAIKEICRFYAIPVVDMTTLFNEDFQFDNGRTSALSVMDKDGIHPNVAGHRRIAECLFRYCTSNIVI